MLWWAGWHEPIQPLPWQQARSAWDVPFCPGSCRCLTGGCLDSSASFITEGSPVVLLRWFKSHQSCLSCRGLCDGYLQCKVLPWYRWVGLLLLVIFLTGQNICIPRCCCCVSLSDRRARLQQLCRGRGVLSELPCGYHRAVALLCSFLS